LQQLSLASSGEIAHTFFSSSSYAGPSPARSGCPAAFGTLACPIRVSSEQGTAFTGFGTDSELQSILGGLTKPAQAPLAIQRFLAETTMIREESPGAGDRVVQATLPAFWDPSPALTHRLFNELSLAPWLKTVTPARGLHLSSQRAQRKAVRTLSPASQQPSNDYFGEILRAQSAIDAFSSMDPPAGVLARLHTDTLIAQDRAWWRTPQLLVRGSTYPLSVQAEIDGVMSKLSLVAAKDITLTSKRGRIRLDLANNADYPLRVTLHLSAQKLTFASGTTDIRRSLSIKGGGQKAMDIKVASQASGVSNVQIRVETPDGSRVVTTRTLTVRSTNFNQIALAITIGALLFLILFYATRPLRKRRASRRKPGLSEQQEDPAPESSG
jgi:hypothetical protein